MMNVWMSITLFAITFFGPVSSYFENCIGERCFTISGSNETKNFNDSKNWCKERTSSLAVVNDDATREDLIRFLNSVQLNEQPKPSMFIDLQLKKTGNTWNLFNGTPYLGGLGIQNEAQYLCYGCVQYRSSKYNVDGSKPNSHRNFICEYEVNRCSNNSTNNYVNKGECFVKYENENLTWFQARERCRNNSGDLATFNYDSGTTGFPNDVPFNTSWLNQSLSYWVGIRYKDWLWKSSDDGKEVIYTWWSSEEPNNINYECVCVDTNGVPVWSWTDCDCNEQRQFICLKIVPTTTVTTTTTTTASTTSSTASFSSANSFTTTNVLAIGLGAGLGGGVFIILLIVVIVVAVTLTRKRRRKNNDVEYLNEVENTGEDKKNKTPNVEFAAAEETETYAQVLPTTQDPVNNNKAQSNIIYSTPDFDQNQTPERSSFDPTNIRRGNAQSILFEGSGDVYANATSVS